ncbi:MAG TPA: hypothetical protein DIC36_06150 [Gammaproteobacteria bacterium]|nr:hypothetical protein [Gammaproteobacteria bacterium]
MTKVLRVIAIAALFAVGSPALLAAEKAADKGAGKSGAIVLTSSMHAKATVVGVKQKEREITLRDEKGAEMTMVAGDEVRNFKQIKKGDIVEVEYHVAVASMLEKVKNMNVAGESSAVQRAPAGAKPGVMAEHTRTIIATVLEVNAKERLLTAQGPKGGVVTIKVPAEMKTFDSLKKGDKISAVYSEAIAVSVKTPEKKK